MAFSRSARVFVLIIICLIGVFTLSACANQPVTPAPATPAVPAPPPAIQTPQPETLPPSVPSQPTAPRQPAAPSLPPPAPTTNESVKEVTLSGTAFLPVTITIPVGGKVIWTNKDSVPHTVTSDTGVFGSSALSRGDTFTFTFNQAGTFTYHCDFHPSMKATVIVGDGAAPSGSSTSAPPPSNSNSSSDYNY